MNVIRMIFCKHIFQQVGEIQLYQYDGWELIYEKGLMEGTFKRYARVMECIKCHYKELHETEKFVERLEQ